MAGPLSVHEMKLVQRGLLEFQKSEFCWQQVTYKYLPHRYSDPAPERTCAPIPGAL